MKRLLPILQIIFLSIAVILAVSFLAPLPIPYYQDFSVLYFSNKGLLQGIHLYDYPTQLEMVLAQTRPDFTFHPYPYPPWYALSTLYLAVLPIYVAARVWFLLNLVMIAAATWLLTPRWKSPFRLFAILGAVLFIPAFGLLIVGQYSTPVLLGTALFIHAERKRSAMGTALALGLMTFKPHIGIFLALAGFGWLLYRRETPFARRAIVMTVILAVMLAALGFLADPAWPQAYLESLGRYRDIPGVQSCGLCASPSVGLVRVATGRSDMLQATWVSLILAGGLAGLFLWQFRSLLRHPAHLTALSAAFTLLIDPYLLNYDYILLLVPLFLLAQARKWQVVIPYLIPWIALAFGREGNLLLSLSTLIILLIYWKNRDEIVLSGLPVVR